MREQTHRFHSSVLGNERPLWIRRSPGTHLPLLILLDGEVYREEMDVFSCLEELEEAGRIPPPLAVLVSRHSPARRWVECPCHPPFAAFIRDELLPWLESRFDLASDPARRIIGGASYTGLAAAYAALENGGRLGRVLSQSGAFWAEDGAFLHLLEERPAAPLRFHLEVGNAETQAPLEHRPDVVQKESQLAVNRRLRDLLQRKGYAVDYREIAEGTHHPNSWRSALPTLLAAVLQPTADDSPDDTGTGLRGVS
ncbi:MAG: alpha/beta hydrolase-fold protein [Opitutales bacterium]